MSFQQSCKRPVIDAADIRGALPSHTAKRLARAMNLSLDTAKHWIYHGPARSRCAELARVLRIEIDRQIAELERARDGIPGGGE